MIQRIGVAQLRRVKFQIKTPKPNSAKTMKIYTLLCADSTAPLRVK